MREKTQGLAKTNSLFVQAVVPISPLAHLPMRPLVPSFCLCLCLGLSLCPGRGAHAEPQPTVKLTYLRPLAAESCPDEETMRRGVAARLGREPFAVDSERSLSVALEATRRGFSVEILVYDASGSVVGKRSLATERKDCAELASAMQLAIAMAIDPLHNMPAPPAVVESAEAEPPPSVPSEPAAQLESVPPLRPAPLPATVSSRHVGVGISLAATTEPNPSAGLTAQYGHRGAFTAWAMEMRLDMPTSVSDKSGTVETSLWAGSLLACLHKYRTEACALASVGSLRGRGSGYGESESFSTPYAAGGLRLARWIAVGPEFAIQVSGDILGRLNTTTLLVDNDEVWTSSPFEVALGARAQWRLE